MTHWGYLLSVFFAVFLWWFSTGSIMALYGRPQRVVRVGFAVLSAGGLSALLLLLALRENAAPVAVLLSVTSGVTLWGWQLAAHYFGYVTGPALPPITRSHAQRSLPERLGLALRLTLYHELLAVLTGVLLIALTWGAANAWGAWIYAVLWLMHASAKLNVFLGVRNFRIEMLPSEMRYLGHLLERRPYNALFPVSVALASGVALVLGYQAVNPGVEPGYALGLIQVATMITLGVFEHWLLVLPLPATLWGWGLRALPEVVEVTSQHPPSPLESQQRSSADSVMKGRS